MHRHRLWLTRLICTIPAWSDRGNARQDVEVAAIKSHGLAWLNAEKKTAQKNPGASEAGSVAFTATSPMPTTAQHGNVAGFGGIVA